MLIGVRILVIDNYDSFVYNLVQYLAQLGAQCVVRRNDAVEAGDVAAADGVLISPGPGTPERAGASMDVVQDCAERDRPVLGVCLGHQAIAAAWGATVARAPELLHGKVSVVHHDGIAVLAGLPQPFVATRYHSLTVLPETIPDELQVTGRTESGIVMALRHRELPVYGVQFHPESVLTDGGHRLLANWLRIMGADVPESRVVELETGMRKLASAAAVR
jgi:para-aminobenzoate synthetase component II